MGVAASADGVAAAIAASTADDLQTCMGGLDDSTRNKIREGMKQFSATPDGQETGNAAECEAPEDAIAQVVKKNIHTWKDVDFTQIEIKEVSGCGGSKTFRVSICEASGASEASADIAPAAIAFHSRSDFNKPLLEERNIAAGRAFAKAGIGPMLIAEDEDFRWCISEWAGEAIVEKFTGPGCRNEALGVAAVEKMMIWSHAGEFREHIGQVLGRIHRLPTDWAEPFLAQKPFLLSDKFPTLGCLGQKTLHTQSLEDMPPQMLERWGRAIDILNTSESTALAHRVVTLHADFHCGNILIRDGRSVGVENAEPRLCAIDFEFANIGKAAFDLGYAFIVNKALLNNAANKRAFIKGYVAAVTAGSSDHVSCQDVENLLVDCEIASVKAWPPSEFIGVPDTDADTYGALVRRLAEFCSLALVPADPLKEMHAVTLREELLEKGAFVLIREWHQS